MAESKREKGSAIVPFKGKMDATEKSKWNPFVIILIELIILGSIGGLFFLIKQFANTNGCGSEVWKYISNGGVEIVSVVIGAVVAKLTPVTKIKKLKPKALHRFVSITIPILIFLIGGLSCLCLLTFFDIKGVVEEKNEAKNQLPQSTIIQVGSMQMSNDNGQKMKEVKEIVTYKITQDLYMENRPLEDYYSGEITAENSISVKAEILYDNVEYNKPKESTSDNYRQLLETADYYYETYIFQKGYADKKNNTSDEWFEDRIISLQKSRDSRISAEKEGESPENERPIATGFRDEGDEYLRRGNQNAAMDNYEQSAGWFMTAIYHAAAMEDAEEVNKCMEKFKELGEEVKKLDDIDLNRRNNIIEWIEVYEMFVGLL